MMYIQDFPSATQAHVCTCGAGYSSYGFLAQLERVLSSLSIPPNHAAMQKLHEYSFQGARAHIVASWPIQSVARGWSNMEEAGLSRLGHVARALCPTIEPSLRMEAQGSSLASYDRRWLEQFYLLACGYPTSILPLTSKRTENPSPEFVQAVGIQDWPPIQILFPTQSYVVHKSVEGRQGGGCFFGKPDDFHRRQLRGLFAQPISERGHLLIHAKSILVTNDTYSNGYVYLGSHNFTRAAWGTVSGTPEHPTQSLSNWELGVVLPLSHKDAWDAILYQRPAQPYGAHDAPWDANSLAA